MPEALYPRRASRSAFTEALNLERALASGTHLHPNRLDHALVDCDGTVALRAETTEEWVQSTGVWWHPGNRCRWHWIDAAAVTSVGMNYASWEEVPDRHLATENPPRRDVDRIWREDRARIRCRNCNRHYIARVSDTPDCDDCRSGKAPRPMPAVDASEYQRISRAR
jgi:hypothetical protein